MSQKTTKRGFTLIELLVVIAIIAILAAILFPVFARAREKARQTTCTSNQRQIAALVSMYVQDHEETFPSTATVWSNIGVDSGALVCPTKGKNTPNGYVYSCQVANKGLGDVSDPTAEMVLADGGHGTSPGPAGSPNVAYTPADLDYRHSGQLIVAFADGHVASLKDFNFGWAKLGELTAANDQNFTGGNALVVDANAPLTGKPAMTLPSTFQSGTLKQMAVGKYGYAIFNWQNYGDSVLNVQAPYTSVTKSASGWANEQYCKFEYKIGANSYGGKALYANKVASISVTLSDFDEHIITILSPAKFADTRRFAVNVTSESGAAKESILSYDWTVQNHTRGKVLQVIIHSSAKITISVPNGTADCGTFSSVFLD